MDVVSKKVMNAGAGIVVRQFVPTRIERQVLAQVFALVCDGQRGETDASSSCFGNAAVRHAVDDEQSTEPGISGRRAA